MQFQNNLYDAFNNRMLSSMGCFLSELESRNKFVEGVGNLTEGYGDAFEGAIGCSFPKDLDDGHAYNYGFNGIHFECFDEEITVDVPTFRKYLRIACEVYWEMYPESRSQLEEYLARPQPPLEEGALPLWKEMRDAGKYPKPYSEFE